LQPPAGRNSACVVEQVLEFVDVDSDAFTVEPVAIALAGHGIAEEASRISDGLVETVTASLWIVARPERFEDRVALCALASQGEECDQLESPRA